MSAKRQNNSDESSIAFDSCQHKSQDANNSHSTATGLKRTYREAAAHLHIACGHLGERGEAPGDAHELGSDFGADSRRQVGRDVVHLQLDQLEDVRLVSVQLQRHVSRAQHPLQVLPGQLLAGCCGSRHRHHHDRRLQALQTHQTSHTVGYIEQHL